MPAPPPPPANPPPPLPPPPSPPFNVRFLRVRLPAARPVLNPPDTWKNRNFGAADNVPIAAPFPSIVMALVIAAKAFGPYHQSTGSKIWYEPFVASWIVPPPLPLSVLIALRNAVISPFATLI